MVKHVFGGHNPIFLVDRHTVFYSRKSMTMLVIFTSNASVRREDYAEIIVFTGLINCTELLRVGRCYLVALNVHYYSNMLTDLLPPPLFCVVFARNCSSVTIKKLQGSLLANKLGGLVFF
jgi:hypothetical protein